MSGGEETIADLERRIQEGQALTDEAQARISGAEAAIKSVDSADEAILLSEGPNDGKDALDRNDGERKRLERELALARLVLQRTESMTATCRTHLAQLRAAEAWQKQLSAFLLLREEAADLAIRIEEGVPSLSELMGRFQVLRQRCETEFSEMPGAIEFSKALPSLILIPNGFIHKHFLGRGWRQVGAPPSSGVLNWVLVPMLPPDPPLAVPTSDASAPAEELMSLEELEEVKAEEFARLDSNAGGARLSEEASQAAGYGTTRSSDSDQG